MTSNQHINRGIISIIKAQPNYPDPILIRTIPFYIQQKFGKSWDDLVLEAGLGKMTLTKYLELMEAESGEFKVYKKGPGLHEVAVVKDLDNISTPSKSLSTPEPKLVKTATPSSSSHERIDTPNVTSTSTVTSSPNVKPSSFLLKGSPSSLNTSQLQTQQSEVSSRIQTHQISIRSNVEKTQQESGPPKIVPRSTISSSAPSKYASPPIIPSRGSRNFNHIETSKTTNTSTTSSSSSIPSTSSFPESNPSNEKVNLFETKEILSGIVENQTTHSTKVPDFDTGLYSDFELEKEKLNAELDELTKYIEEQSASQSKPLFGSTLFGSNESSEDVDSMLKELKEEEKYLNEQLENTEVESEEHPSDKNIEEAEENHVEETETFGEAEENHLEESETFDDTQEVSSSPPVCIETTYIYQWLKKIEMEKYTQNFLEYGVEDESTLLGLEKSDLNKMRIRNLDDRNIITEVLELEKKRHSLSGLDFDF